MIISPIVSFLGAFFTSRRASLYYADKLTSSERPTVNSEVSKRVSTANGDTIFQECLEQVTNALRDGSDQWKSLFPGRYILQKFSSQNGLGDWPSLQNLIIERLATGNFPIDPELRKIFNEIQK